MPQEGYEAFSSNFVVAAPANGAIYWDGTPISWTMVDSPEGAQFDVDLSYVNTDGDAVEIGGFFLEDLGDNVWSSSLNVFDSNAHERPAFAVLGVTSDTDVWYLGQITGDHEILGVYCLSLRVAP